MIGSLAAGSGPVSESKSLKPGTNSGARSGARQGIPVFSLYGEAAAPQEDDFVHIEEIRTRSERYNWHIDSHLHEGLFQAVFLFSGGAEVELDEAAHTLAAPGVFTIPSSTVHGFRFVPGTDGRVLTIADSLLLRGRESVHAFIEDLVIRPRITNLSSSPQIAVRLSALLNQITIEFRDRAPGSAIIQELMVDSVLFLLAREQASGQDTVGVSPRDVELFNQFRALVEAHYLEHWPVASYAKALGVAISRLNRACRAAANKSAFALVQDRLLLEARRKLIYIAAPVSRLAYELGFEDPAYFWRFFKRHAGFTPVDFRRQVRLKAEGAHAHAREKDGSLRAS
jgi:AraC family transcriptional activator of pobA